MYGHEGIKELRATLIAGEENMIAYPDAYMPEGLIKAYNVAYYRKSWKVRRIRISSVTGLHPNVNRYDAINIIDAILDGSFRYERPKVVQFEGRRYIVDGHHRIYIARELGKEWVEVDYKVL